MTIGDTEIHLIGITWNGSNCRQRQCGCSSPSGVEYNCFRSRQILGSRKRRARCEKKESNQYKYAFHVKSQALESASLLMECRSKLLHSIIKFHRAHSLSCGFLFQARQLLLPVLSAHSTISPPLLYLQA